MKILHVLGTARAEGTPHLVLDWLHEHDFHQEVLILNDVSSDLTKSLHSQAKWLEMWDQTSIRFWGNGAAHEKIRQLCMARKPDVVICWFTGLAHVVISAAHSAGIKHLMVHAGNHPGKSWAGLAMTWRILVLALLKGAEIVCCSQYVCEAYRSYLPLWRRHINAVPNCVRLDRFSCRDTQLCSTPIAIMVATLEPHKDHDTLLRASVFVRKKHPQFQLWLAGDGSLRSKLKQLACDLKLEGCVHFLGMRSDIPALLSKVSLFVFSTTPAEGFGSVLIEALASGLPIVATDVPACREVLQNGRWGKLIPPHDVSSLAKAISNSLSLNERSLHGQQRREYAESFSARTMLHQYLSLTQLSE